MHAYLIRITLGTGQRLRLQGIFRDGCEAITQTLADWPGARAVSAICLRKKGGAA
ncbi:hypothetical protein ACFOHU_08045 [Ottowia pentelensis]|uniref:Transposase n=1 Tax=Ottowia pentelensis TaxID=511108 RepID=A0ABV6PTL9_9BURK